MSNIDRFVIGLRFHTKIFKIATNWGEIVDAIFAARGKKIDEDYYDGIKRSDSEQQTILMNEEKGNELKLSPSEIVFSSASENGGSLNINKEIENFGKILPLLKENIKIRDIRRIGIVCNYIIEPNKKNPSKELIENLTHFSPKDFSAKFHLKFEKRTPSIERVSVDIKKDDFTNVIYQIMDSDVDNDNDGKEFINANIDFQRYYSPTLDGDVMAEVNKLKKYFDKERSNLINKLKALGFEKAIQ